MKIMNMKMNNIRVSTATARAGFTLIELLVVLFILALLATIVVPKFSGQTEKAEFRTAQTQISNFMTALRMFEAEVGRYPTTDEGLQALIQQPANAPGWTKKLEGNTIPLDPWKRPYVYQCPGQHNPDGYDLYSLGPSGQEGGETVNNWSQSSK